MNFDITKIGKNVWYNGELWEVVKHIAPNRHQDFLLLEKETDCGYGCDNLKCEFQATPDCDMATCEDEVTTNAVEMIVIDTHNDCFYPDTNKVKNIMKTISRREELNKKNVDALTKVWLGLFEEEL